jgi:DNA-binding transcriptional MerR regulator
VRPVGGRSGGRLAADDDHRERGPGPSRGERMTVSGLAAATDVPDHVIRYYTRLGLLKPARDAHNAYRLYARSDAARLRFIRRAKHLGYTLGEIATIFREASRGRSPCPLVREIIGRRIPEHRRELREAQLLQRRMERALARWARMPDGVPDGDSVCWLIEST